MRVRPSSGLGFDTGLSANSGLKMAERGRTWGDSETTKLLELWSEGGIQAQLRGMTRNEVPYRKIAEELENSGYKRTFTQCREKALKKKHKEVVGLPILNFRFHILHLPSQIQRYKRTYDSWALPTSSFSDARSSATNTGSQ